MSTSVANLLVVIGADVEKALDGVDDVSKRLNKLEGSLSKGSGFDAFEKIATGALFKVGEVALDLAGGAIQGIAGVFVDSLKKAGDFEASLNGLSVAAGLTHSEMGPLKQLAKDLGSDLTLPGTSASDAADAMNEMVKAGVSVTDTMSAAKGVLQLSAAAQTDNATAAGIVAAALNTFHLKGTEATHVADLLAAGANASSASMTDLGDALKQGGFAFAASNQSADDFITSVAALTNVGLSGSDSATALKNAMMQMMSPTDKARELMGDLGINVYDTLGKMKPWPEVIDTFSKAMADGAVHAAPLPEELDKMGKAALTAQNNLPGLVQNYGFLNEKLRIAQQELQTTTDKYGASSVQAQKQQLAVDQLSASINEQKDKIDAAKNVTAGYEAAQKAATGATITMTQEQRNSALATILGSDGMKALIPLMDLGADGYSKLKDKVTEQGVASKNASVQMEGWNGVLEGFSNIWDGLELALAEPVLEPLTKGFQGLADKVAGLQPSIETFSKQYLAPAIDTILKLANAFIESGDKMKFLQDKINEYKEPIKKAIGGILTSFLDQADTYTPQIVGAAKKLLGAVADEIGKEAPGIGVNLAWGMWEKLKTDNVNDPIFGPMWKFFGTLWTGIRDWWGIHSPSTKMNEIGTNLIDGMWQGLSNASGKVYGLMTDIGMRAKDKLQEWRGAFDGVGTNLIEGLSNGISNRWNELRDMIYGFAGQLPQWFRDQLGIHSPSTIMAEIGRWIPAGLQVGINANADSAKDAVSSLTSDLGASATIGVQASSLGTTAAYTAPGAATRAAGQAIINNYVYLQVDGHVMTERDLIETVREGLKENARRNGYAIVI